MPWRQRVELNWIIIIIITIIIIIITFIIPNRVVFAGSGLKK